MFDMFIDVTHRPHTMVILALLCLLFNFTMLLKKITNYIPTKMFFITFYACAVK